ncbi:MAG TPA: sialidase family protein, partial [Membranihabitans sp.]|nr:sialidase family protein [Membranihabitans sp.]
MCVTIPETFGIRRIDVREKLVNLKAKNAGIVGVLSSRKLSEFNEKIRLFFVQKTAKSTCHNLQKIRFKRFGYASLYLLCFLSGNIYAIPEVQVKGSTSTSPGDSIEILERYIAIDNVCAWPNLTRISDGSLVATIFNQPSHGRKLGDVECWSSHDGKLWQKAGTPAIHDPHTNRMNVAAGLSTSGELIVLASGWEVSGDPEKEENVKLINVLRPWVSISKNNGRDWTVNKSGFPEAETGMTNFVPFGDILEAADGSLRVIGYAQSLDKAINKVSMFRSDDNGRSW